ncbi:MAG: hypothetical protein P8J20_00660 [Novosphingobium sp.]|nr:hypothetical protein [Novosphingobium sp.]
MKRINPTRLVLGAAIAGLLTLVAACTQPPPPSASVAPPPVAYTPYRPVPPKGAPKNLAIPPQQADGKRITVNSNLTSTQTVWNLRSGYNVAALNCTKSKHEAILSGYSAFLKSHAKKLKKVNRDLDRKFRSEHGSKYIKARESYQTQIYNFFSLPPVVPALCDAVLALSVEFQTVQPGQLEGFAPSGLAKLDEVYQQFYDSYDKYTVDLAAWEQRYGTGATVAAGSSSNQSLAQ